MKNSISSLMSDSTSSFSKSISMRWWFTNVSVSKKALLRGNMDMLAIPLGLMNDIKVSLKVSISIYCNS